MAGLEELTGCWDRVLLRLPDGSHDVTSRVTWLQAPDGVVDLRQSAGPTTGSGDPEGFAGVLVQDGPWFSWQRRVDLRPTGAVDTGSLQWHGSLLVERGRHVAYTEHWRRSGHASPAVALQLTSAAREGAVLVRVGSMFGWARSGAALSGEGSGEVSLGRVTDDGWRIERSSRPEREGTAVDLAPRDDEPAASTAWAVLAGRVDAATRAALPPQLSVRGPC